MLIYVADNGKCLLRQAQTPDEMITLHLWRRRVYFSVTDASDLVNYLQNQTSICRAPQSYEICSARLIYKTECRNLGAELKAGSFLAPAAASYNIYH